MNEERVLFTDGMQREFLNLVIQEMNCISLRGLLQFGFDIPYSTLKNYYVERRLLPRSFFENLCYLAKLNVDELNFKFINGNWGQVKGGKS